MQGRKGLSRLIFLEGFPGFIKEGWSILGGLDLEKSLGSTISPRELSEEAPSSLLAKNRSS